MAQTPRTPKRSHPSWKGRFVQAPKLGSRAQRAVVDVRLIPRGARGMRSMVAATALELRYMEKGDRGHDAYPLYQAQDKGPELDPHAFAAETRQDPHQWRLMVSPERSADVDLTQLTRQTMGQLERDTGYRLDWVGVNHYDTGHPHSHVIVRGLDQDGQVVGLKRDYMTHGLRYRVQDLLTQELGPRPLEHTREQDYSVERTVTPDRGVNYVWDRPLIGNRRTEIYHTPEQAHYGDVHPHNQVHFWTERAAQEAGFRRAANDHSGPGTGIARTLQEQAVSGRGLGVGGLFPREAPVSPGLHARLEPEWDRER